MSRLNFSFMSSVANMIYVTAEHTTDVDESPAFKEGMIELGNKYSEAQLLEIILEGKTPGITLDYFKLKKDTSLNFGVGTSLIGGYGAKIGDGKLTKMKSITYSVLLDMTPQHLVVKLDEILGVIDVNKVGLASVGITPAYITKLIALRASVNVDKDNTQHAIKLHNETYDQYLVVIAEMKVIITTILDPMSKFFKLAHQPFYLAYKNARKISHHHIHNKKPPTPDTITGTLALTANDALTGLGKAGVKLEIPSINYEILTDVNGELANELMVPGEYIGKLTCDGCVPIDFTFKIVKAQICELGFMMSALGSN